jgi:hypothetical protein
MVNRHHRQPARGTVEWVSTNNCDEWNVSRHRPIGAINRLRALSIDHRGDRRRHNSVTFM